MLDPAEEVLVVVGLGVEVVEGLELVSVLEIVLAFLGGVVGKDYEFLAFVLGEFSLQLELLLGEVEGLADSCFGVDAGKVEQFDEFLAGLVQNLVVVSYANHMGGTRLGEDLPG